MPNTLAEVIRQKLTDIDIRLYTWQMFSGLKYLDEHKVVHRDLKPVNILVDHTTAYLKISDFGSAKIVVKGKANNFYQVTRFYRPPELLMKALEYDSTVDIWSAGCIVAEMIRKHVVFPGRDSAHQMKLYCRCFGSPTDAEIRAMKAEERLDPELWKFAKGAGLQRLVIEATPEQLQFMKRILVYSPDKRLRGKQLLQDEFFRPLFKSGAVRHNNQKISEVITAADYKRASEWVSRRKNIKL
uniref:Protein kinase domain-containing protein n=1 Tax=Caenorhabditis japonica TaxID=281687 RepID=A0A8R1EEF6_CAEJA